MDMKQVAGERLQQARNAKGLTLSDVCGHFPGLIQSRLSNWENGVNMIPVDWAKKIAELLGVPADYLLTLTDVIPTEPEKRLVEIYRQSDDRGRQAIIRIAEVESVYSVDPSNIPPSNTPSMAA